VVKRGVDGGGGGGGGWVEEVEEVTVGEAVVDKVVDGGGGGWEVVVVVEGLIEDMKMEVEGLLAARPHGWTMERLVVLVVVDLDGGRVEDLHRGGIVTL